MKPDAHSKALFLARNSMDTLLNADADKQMNSIILYETTAYPHNPFTEQNDTSS